MSKQRSTDDVLTKKRADDTAHDPNRPYATIGWTAADVMDNWGAQFLSAEEAEKFLASAARAVSDAMVEAGGNTLHRLVKERSRELYARFQRRVDSIRAYCREHGLPMLGDEPTADSWLAAQLALFPDEEVEMVRLRRVE